MQIIGPVMKVLRVACEWFCIFVVHWSLTYFVTRKSGLREVVSKSQTFDMTLLFSVVE